MKNLSFVGLIALLFLMVCCQDSKINYVSDAVQFLKDGDLAKAKELIDLASESEAINDSAHTWYYKGYVYYELYKNNKNVDGPERSLAMDYFKKSLDIDANSKYAEHSRSQMSNIAITFYNDAVNYISSSDPEKAINSFDVFLQMAVIGEPNEDLDLKRIDIYNALGALYSKLYEADRANRTYWSITEEYFSKVLEIDSVDLNANYNMGVLYYNEAVKKIHETESCKQVEVVESFNWGDPNSVIPSLEDLVECLNTADCKKYKIDVLFRKALPCFEKVKQLEPTDKNVQIGLEGIYFALNKFEI